VIDRARLQSLLSDGMTQTQAARALGVSDEAVRRARGRWGIAYTGQQGPAPKVPRDEFRALWGRLSPREVAQATGCHVVSVYARAKRMGLNG